MQNSPEKPGMRSEIIDSEIASENSSEIEREKVDSDNSRNIGSGVMGKRFSG